MFRKAKAAYYTHPDIFAVSLITVIFLMFVCFDMFILNRGVVWGSDTDWRCQHYAIPEYFRMRFYETHDPFPDFAFQLGAGQNIFELSYYGMVNPLFFPAYILPWVRMSTYIQIMSCCVAVGSAVLVYFFFKRHFKGAMPLILAVMFLCAAPIIYHSHRHIMFVNYFPFLMGMMFTARGGDGTKNLLLTAFYSFSIVCASFYFSIGAFAAVFCYMIYLVLEREDKFTFKVAWISIRKKLLFMVLGVISSALLWLPTLNAILLGRANTSQSFDLIDFLPMVKVELLFYSTASPGVTAVAAAAVIYAIMSGKAKDRFIAVVLACCVALPVMTYIMNAGMYIDGKVLIPFLPLILLLCGNFFVSYMKSEVKIKVIILMMAVIAVVSFADGLSRISSQVLFLSDAAMTCIILFIGAKKNKRQMLLIEAMACSVLTATVTCTWDKLAKRRDIESFYSKDAASLVDDILDDADHLFRIAGQSNNLTNVNRIYRTDYLTTNIYSSLSNKYFRKFRLESSGSDVNTRNNAIQQQPMNVIFNTLMGCRYRLTNIDKGYLGETFVSASGDYYIYENPNALPLGYAAADVISLADYNALPWYQRNETILSSIIVPYDVETNFSASRTVPLNVDFTAGDEGNGITEENGIFIVKSEKPVTISIDLDEPVTDKVILIRCMADNRIGKLKKQADVTLTINGITNKLCAPMWKYHNGNYEFIYTVSSNEPIEKLDFVFSKGNYVLSGFEAYSMDGSVLTEAGSNKYPLMIKHERAIGDSISGQINVKEDSWFNLSVPYDKNITVMVDGKKTDFVKTNMAFIGFPIKAGEHDITVSYEAPMKRLGLAVGFSGMAAVLLLALVFRFLDRRAKLRDVK